MDTVTIELYIKPTEYKTDIEVPLNITANDLFLALNEAYSLGVDVANIRNCYLKAERPIALLRGNKQLSEYGIRNGTRITFS